MIKVEKNIPLPPRKKSIGRPAKYPWKDMEIGDSFLISKPGLTLARVSGAISSGKRKTGFNFSIRMVKEGVRVWRVS